MVVVVLLMPLMKKNNHQAHLDWAALTDNGSLQSDILQSRGQVDILQVIIEETWLLLRAHSFTSNFQTTIGFGVSRQTTCFSTNVRHKMLRITLMNASLERGLSLSSSGHVRHVWGNLWTIYCITSKCIFWSGPQTF